MIVVIHYENKDPDIYFGITKTAEKKIINAVNSKDYAVSRCSPEEWYGQDNDRYDIHHWNARKKRRNT